METIKIGRREVEKALFIKAVQDNKSLSDIIVAMGWNITPTSTREAVLDAISELELDTSHLKQMKKPNENLCFKQFTLSSDNRIYLDSFLNSLTDKSRATYKASCGNFLEELVSQDFITITKEQILEFADTKNTESMKRNVEAHLRSLMIYCVNNDINNSIVKVDKQMLIWLISK